MLVDQRGRSLLDYPDLDVPPPDRDVATGWARPRSGSTPRRPGVAERLAATFAELVRGYPGLDGLHLDYIRYPDVLPFSPGSRFGVGLDFGYGAATRARFQRARRASRRPSATSLGERRRAGTPGGASSSRALVARIAQRGARRAAGRSRSPPP